MKDTHLERIALLSIIAGLILILMIIPKYEAIDAHFLNEDDNKAYLEGEIQRKSYNNNTDWSFLEIKSCKNFKAFYKGNITKKEGDTIHIKGQYRDHTFSIKEYK